MEMNDIYKKNLETIAKYYPGMEKQVEDYRIQFDAEGKSELELIYEPDGCLKVKKDNKERYLTGKREPDRPVTEWYEYIEKKLNKQSVITFIGIGDGRYLNFIANKVEPSVKIFIYEPSFEIFLSYIQRVELTELMEKAIIIFIVPGMNDSQYEEILKSLLVYERLSSNVLYALPNYMSLFPEACGEFLKKVKDIEVNLAVQHNTNLIFADVVSQNVLLNMKHLLHGYKTSQLAKVIPQDIPAIVVAAGPSLNKNIHELKRAKNKAFIIAVDTAVKPLLRAGIIPDMYAVIDGLKPVELVQAKGAENIPLMTSIASANGILEMHQGKKFFYAEGYRYVKELFSINNLTFEPVARGGSVATSAFSLAYMIGINTIILVGQDLALTNNRTHADGTFQEKMEEIDTTNCIMVEGNYEEKVPTRTDFKTFLDWFNYYIEGCQKRRKLRVINATEGGAKIQNTEIMTLKEAIDEVCVREVNIAECIDKLTPVFDAESLDKSKGYIKKMPEQFNEIALAAAKIGKGYQKLSRIAKNSKGKSQTGIEKINKTANKYQKQMERNPVYQFVNMSLVNANYMLQREAYYEEDTLQDELAEIARKGSLYMKLVKECAEMLQKYSTTEIVPQIVNENK